MGADYGWGPEERLRYGFDSEVVNFDRDPGVTGWRFDAMPVRLAGFRSARACSCAPASRSATPATRSKIQTPRACARTRRARCRSTSLDAGMIFERDSGSRAQRRLTLEPRLLYLNVPYRDQDDLPLFDTGTPDLNLVAAVPHEPLRRRGSRERRGSGEPRRHEPAVRCARAARNFSPSRSARRTTSRSRASGCRTSRSATATPRTSSASSRSTAYKNWNADFGLQWNPDQSRYERAQANIQFKPAGEQVVNLGYRFQREQAGTSTSSRAPGRSPRTGTASPATSIPSSTTRPIERFAGFEYASCCWRVRFVGRKFVSTRTGEQDTGIYLQLELTGLASVGSAADAFLTGAIRGYERPDAKARARPGTFDSNKKSCK